MLSIEETLAILATRLKRTVSYDSIAIFVAHNRILVPKFVCGDAAVALAAMEIPFGYGLTAWVAENRKPIAKGNPAVEPGYAGVRLRSALSVPWEAGGRLYGVLTLDSSEEIVGRLWLGELAK